MKSIAMLAIGFCLLPTLCAAQTSQFDAVLAPVGWGAGPQAFGVAPGRSFTNIYGSVDLAANLTNAAGKSTVRLQSGNDWTSKLGFYGQEDLGDQWSAFFRLESGLYANTGAMQDSNSFFNRGSFVGIQQPRFGQLTVGRQYTSMGSAVLGVDPFLVTAHDSVAAYLLTAGDLAAGANADTLSRANNTVRYVTPRSAWGLGAWAAEGKSLTAIGTGGALRRHGRELSSLRPRPDAAASRGPAGLATRGASGALHQRRCR